MLLAILTDLHPNREAVEAVLDHAASQGATSYAFLGDLIGYGAEPAWVVDTVMAYAERGAFVVLGNHNEVAFQIDRTGMKSSVREALSWTYVQLNDTQREFLLALPFELSVGDIELVHVNAWAPAA